MQGKTRLFARALESMVLSSALILTAGCCRNDNPFEALNRQAAEEYLEPVRPGYEGRNPFWNGFATKFIYAPAFGFGTVEGAEKYRFTFKVRDESLEQILFMLSNTSPIRYREKEGNYELYIKQHVEPKSKKGGTRAGSS